MQKIQDVLGPLDPVIDVLTTRVPVLSDISLLRGKFDSNGDGTVTIIETAKTLQPENQALKFIDTVIQIKQFIDRIPTLGANVILNLGGFSLNANGADPRSLGSGGLAGVNLTNFTGTANIKAELRGLAASLGVPKLGSFVDGLELPELAPAADTSGLSFPLLEKPATALNLLLGKDVDLFVYDMPALKAGFTLDEFFRILGPLGVRIQGGLEAKIDLSFGYDTGGIRQFADGGFSKPALIFDGFYVSDTHNDGVDLPEATLTASIKAFAELNAIVFAAGVGGGITATINLDLKDPNVTPEAPNGDGKLRVSEIIQQFEVGPLCLFTFSGTMTAGLSAYVKVGVDTPLGFAGWKKTFNIAEATLLDFSFGCKEPAPAEPILATVISPGVLRLNMGPNAPDRVHRYIVDDDENFTVTPGAAAGEVVVKAFGYSQTFGDISTITGQGGNGNDIITIEPGVSAGADLWGDFSSGMAPTDGDDRLFAGNGPANLHGGGGNDELSLRLAPGKLYGDDGDDLLIGAAGNDLLEGGEGDDILDGFGGDDILRGGDGDDVLRGGDGVDDIDGGNGGDQAEGGAGNDLIVGGLGNDILQGDDGDDVIHGGDGNDIIAGDVVELILDESAAADESNKDVLGLSGTVDLVGGTGNDTLTGGTGSDAMFGQGGTDNISAGEGEDYMEGNGGTDTLNGDDGDDRMIGGSAEAGAIAGIDGNDIMNGGAGNDIMAGDNASISAANVVALIDGAGNDTMNGDAGDDKMYGQGGADGMIGGTGADLLDGGDGNDRMTGDSSIAGLTGIDTMNGGAGRDTMIGDNGTVTGLNVVTLLADGSGDFMSGGGDGDYMYGQGGNDTMGGDAGDDYMEGNDGNDIMSGGGNNDTMFGNAGLDTMHGNDGIDTMSGGDGADTMFGDADGDIMTGDAGDDYMEGNAGNDNMLGGADDDDMIGGANNDTMGGGTGHDVMLGDDGTITRTGQLIYNTDGTVRTAARAVTLTGGDGVDGMTGGDGHDLMFGQGGNDTMAGDAGDDDMIGGLGADDMTGGAGADVMLGDTGTITTLIGLTPPSQPGTPTAILRTVTLASSNADGGDTMRGGDGDDTMNGQGANDLMFGDAGRDSMIGELGDDTMDGGAGDDGMLGDKGTLVLSIETGSRQRTIASNADKVSAVIFAAGTNLWTATLIDPALGGVDLMSGGGGSDYLHGGAAADILRGDAPNGGGPLPTDAGNDALFGNLGDDLIFGDSGQDLLFGGGGDDDLNGGTGADIAYGGGGQDTLWADERDDRLHDWFGNFNQFNVPGPGYGSPTINRTPNPSMRQFFFDLATGNGSLDAEGELEIITPSSPENAGPGPGGGGKN